MKKHTICIGLISVSALLLLGFSNRSDEKKEISPLSETQEVQAPTESKLIKMKDTHKTRSTTEQQTFISVLDHVDTANVKFIPDMGYETIEIYQKGAKLVPPKKEVQIERK